MPSLKNIMGGAAVMAALSDERERNEANEAAKWAALGKTPPVRTPSRLEQGLTKLKGLMSAKAPTPAAPASPVTTGDNVGLIDRIKAGNIDEPGSEANMRWGSGKVGMDDALANDIKPDGPMTDDMAINSMASEGAAPGARGISINTSGENPKMLSGWNQGWHNDGGSPNAEPVPFFSSQS